MSLPHLSVLPPFSQRQPLLPVFLYICIDIQYICFYLFVFYTNGNMICTQFYMLVFKVNIFGGSFYINHTSLIFFNCMVNGQIPTHNLLKQSTIVLVRIDQVILQKQIIPQISVVYFLLTECLLRFWATVQGKCLSIWLLSNHLFAFPPSYSCTIWVKWPPQLMPQQKREFWPRSKPPLLQPKTDAHTLHAIDSPEFISWPRITAMTVRK